MPSKLALQIAKNEGFGIARTLPTLDNNPGDLRHSPHSEHSATAPNAIGKIDTVADGWADLERQLGIYAARTISIDPQTLTPCSPRLMNLHDLAYTYAPVGDGNPTAAYLNSLCVGLGVGPDTTVVAALALG